MIEKYYSCNYIINCIANNIKTPFFPSPFPLSYFPLIFYNYWSIFEFWNYSTKLLLKKYVAPKIKDIKQKIIFIL